VLERYPFAHAAAQAAIESVEANAGPNSVPIETIRAELPVQLRRRLASTADGLPEPTPRVPASGRWASAVEELVEACDGFLRRAEIEASLTKEERIEILRGMALTRATDNRLKTLFTGGEVRYGDAAFQGKGFRSLGQEAIYAAAIRLRRGGAYRTEHGWRGDVVAPMIRDLGVTLAMRSDADMVRLVLSAQMGKAGPPMNGRDLHVGDFDSGILPATAPLGIGSLTIAGLAMAFAREAGGRVALSFIGEGGSSLGEWHEAINVCSARRLPAIFCVQNNQTALSTPVRDQSAVRVFADKAAGYGIPGITIDGTDPDAIAAAFAWAVERARAGAGPALIELVCMRMCGHAHHDDMLYLGRDPVPAWDYPSTAEQGYVDRESYAYWSARDPLATYAARLAADGLIGGTDLDAIEREMDALVDEQARAVIEAPWPDVASTGTGVFADEPARQRVEVLAPRIRNAEDEREPPSVEPIGAHDPRGSTFLEAVAAGIADALRADPRVFVFGEDVGGQYGNAFLLLRPLLSEFGSRIVNAPLAEGAIIGVCIGAALGGQRPIGEMQFNDFVATGFNQLVNSAAKIRYRWGGAVPMVLRMPWGGLRHAGPYHSQNTEAWFYRTPGLKIVAPSTPLDARALLASAVADPDPVLYYEHIALYRDPRVKQALSKEPPPPLPIGTAALRRAGTDLAIVSYGAYVHAALAVAERLSSDGIDAAVLDLRTLQPLDKRAILSLAKVCSRVLIVHEDTRTGSIGESVAAIIQEEAFEYLDAPVRILAALDTPVPYSPPLEAAFLPSDAEIERAARLLAAY
jgi:2-oxoisovalerate dehydrogenase E1 component